jgi:hypothetical protein
MKFNNLMMMMVVATLLRVKDARKKKEGIMKIFLCLSSLIARRVAVSLNDAPTRILFRSLLFSHKY